MRTVSSFFAALLLVSWSSTLDANNAGDKPMPVRRPECAALTSRVQGPPPLPIFLPYRTPWDRIVVISEEQSVVVGELLVPCFSDTAPPDFKLLPPTPAFVKVLPFACTCLNQAKAYVVLTPRLGDRGKYTVTVAGVGCGGIVDGSNQDSFEVRVKKAPQD